MSTTRPLHHPAYTQQISTVLAAFEIMSADERAETLGFMAFTVKHHVIPSWQVATSQASRERRDEDRQIRILGEAV